MLQCIENLWLYVFGGTILCKALGIGYITNRQLKYLNKKPMAKYSAENA